MIVRNLSDYLWNEVFHINSDNPLDAAPYFHNLQLWVSKFNPILYITGISGGGKGYVAKKIAEVYSDTIIFELDKFENYPWYVNTPEDNSAVAKGDAIIYAWIDENFDTRTDFFMNSPRRYQEYMGKLHAYLIDYTSKHPRYRYIVEGIQLFCDSCFNSIDGSDSIIFIKTTKIASMQKNLERKHAIIRNRFHAHTGAMDKILAMERRVRGSSQALTDS